nr:hypothetical protein [Acidiferrobacter sp.]
MPSPTSRPVASTTRAASAGHASSAASVPARALRDIRPCHTKSGATRAFNSSARASRWSALGEHEDLAAGGEGALDRDRHAPLAIMRQETKYLLDTGLWRVHAKTCPDPRNHLAVGGRIGEFHDPIPKRAIVQEDHGLAAVAPDRGRGETQHGSGAGRPQDRLEGGRAHMMTLVDDDVAIISDHGVYGLPAPKRL